MRVPVKLAASQQGYLNNQLSPIKTVNMRHVRVPGTDEIALVMTPGSQPRFTRTGKDRVRAQFVYKNNLFVVYGDEVVRHDTALDPVGLTPLLNTTSGHVGIADNQAGQIVFVDNVNGWVYDVDAATFTQITDVDFPAQPGDVAYLDGHILVAQTSSNRWYISDIDDATSWSALNFAELTSESDTLVAIRVVNRRIFVFGNLVTEVFYNSGNASSFPFVRDNNVVIQLGCASANSVAQDENMLVWLATSGEGAPSIQMTAGGSPKRISTPDVESAIQSYTNPGACCAFLYNISGHTFYLINFEVDGFTWVYDFSMQRWHSQEMINGSNYFACSHSFFNNRHYLGHYNAPTLSEMSEAYTTNGTENIHCLHIPAPLMVPQAPKFELLRFELELFQGLGALTTTLLPNGQYDDFELNPLVYLSLSYDRGATYTQSVAASSGKTGEYGLITSWNGLGVNREFVLKIETFHRAKTAFVRAYAEIEPQGY